MLVLSRIDVETFSVSLVSETISNFTSEDQTTALHVVIHDIFKDWGEFFVVNKVEEYFFISGNVDSDVTFDKVKKTFMLKCKVFSPIPFFSFLIINSLKEQNVARTSSNETCFFDQKHGSEINFADLLLLSFNNLGVIILLKLDSE